MKNLAVVVVGLLLPLSASLAQQSAQSAPRAPCTGTDYRTLDFWVGDWVAHDQQGKPIGENRITRNEYGECVITEHFRLNDGTLVGHSVSTYRPGISKWRQVWVDNQGGFFDLVGGPVTGSDHIFVFENKRLSETQPEQRMIFQEVKPDSFTWRWQSRAKSADAWADSWVILYKKK
jgi:hypothetical protein